MTIKVIGAGFGRTGTLSLKNALEQLGFDKCYHMMEVFQNPSHREVWADAAHGRPVDWDATFEGYQAAVDWPSSRFWKEMADYYPDAKVILSVRNPKSWYKSVMDTIYRSSTSTDTSTPAGKAQRQWIDDLVWEGVFDGKVEDEAEAIAVFERNSELVKATIAPERLLVFEAAMGWQPLCEFLDCPVPASDYPRVNSTEEFQGRFKAT